MHPPPITVSLSPWNHVYHWLPHYNMSTLKASTGSSHLCISSLSIVSGMLWPFVKRRGPGQPAVLNTHHLGSKGTHKVALCRAENRAPILRTMEIHMQFHSDLCAPRTGKIWEECKVLPHPSRSGHHLLQWVRRSLNICNCDPPVKAMGFL